MQLPLGLLTRIRQCSTQARSNRENRVKPNIAYVGSDVMSVAHNTGDGYTAFSGTSMATPGAAGLQL